MTQISNIIANMDDQKKCLDIVATAKSNLMVKILNVNGQFIKTINKTVQSNAGRFTVALDDLSRGNYILNIFENNAFIRSFNYKKY